MAEDLQSERRTSLLDFLERHWRELSLRDAHALSVELLEGPADASPMIKETLTFS
jgi:hypothetical protein